jgi:hypothetical protein
MFSAISATRLAILDAIIVYGDMLLGCAPFAAPLVEGALFLVVFPAGFFDLEAAVRFVVRFTGAEATEAAGILSVLRGLVLIVSVLQDVSLRFKCRYEGCSRATLGSRRCPAGVRQLPGRKTNLLIEIRR